MVELCILAGVCLQAGATPPVRVIRHVAMATDFEIILYGASANTDPEALLAAGRKAFAALDNLEQRISSWYSGSFTSMVNRMGHQKPVVVPADLTELLLASKRYYDLTEGTFDVTVGSLIRFWRECEKTGALPEPDDLKRVLNKTGLKHVEIDSRARTVFLKREGIRLDFGGIAKGWALDRMANILLDEGIEQARLSSGTSSILTVGSPPGKTGWTVDIRSPYNTSDTEHIATVEICNESLSTSADTVRYMGIDGKRFSHIIDPRTGWPVEAGLSSVTVIAPTAMETDALSTAFFVMGVEAVRSYCEEHPQVRAILVTDDTMERETIFLNFVDETIKKE